MAVHLEAVVTNSVASRRYFISLLSLSCSTHVRECVAWAAARTACPSDPRPSLTRPSALACSLEMRLVLSLWENTLSCASEAFLSRSYVLCHASRTGNSQIKMTTTNHRVMSCKVCQIGYRS